MIIPTLFVLASSPAVPLKNTVSNVPEVSVPFACGRIHTVSQGHDTGSHQHNDTYAWDFRMPEGTPIVAAHSGVVRMARGDSNKGGCDEKMAPFANYVVVSRGDGTETQYLHFSAVVVKVGERVKEGQLIGFSGSTGWSCGPHLHFKVAREGRGWNNPSIPATIAGYGDPLRDTRIAAPACKDANQPMMAAGDNSRAGESIVSFSSGTAQGDEATRGLPPGAKAVLDSLGEPPAQGGVGTREARPTRAADPVRTAAETR
jgi:hypothetical protein